MKDLLTIAAMVVLMVPASGCRDGGSDGDRQAALSRDAEVIRGEYLFGHEVRVLRPCGEEDDLWVIDDSRRLAGLYERLTGGRAGDVRIRVIAVGSRGAAPQEGFGAGYPGSVTIGEVIYAAVEGFGCDFDLGGFSYRASGTEPFWMVEVGPGRMKMSRPGEPDRSWTDVSREETGDSIVYTGSDAEGTGVLTILPDPGHDAMSGAYYNRSARFRWGEYDLRGQALQGQAGGTP